MSNTPRTDGIAREPGQPDFPTFARQLERELAEARADNAALLRVANLYQEEAGKLTAERDKLQARNIELRSANGYAELEAENAKLRRHAEAMYREIKRPQNDSEFVADHYRADFPKEGT